MKILGIDTATKSLSLGIYDDGRVYECELESGRKLSSLLAPVTARCLEAAGLEVADIDYFACGLGPGSFTGMRIGIAFIKGMAWAAKKPVAGISTLDILAKNVSGASEEIVTAVDAKRDLIYCSIYKNKNGVLKRMAPHMLLSPDQLLKKVKPNSIILGDAAGLYKELFLRRVKGAVVLDRDHWYPKANNLIELALARIKGKELTDCFRLKPIYLYPDECQVRRASNRKSGVK